MPVPYSWPHANATHAHGHILPALLSLVPRSPRLRIADLGCGNGYTAGVLADLGHEVVGVDGSEEGIAQARRARPGLRFEVASVYDDVSAVLGADFDLVISTEVIEHLERPRALLENALRLLRPEGRLIVSAPYHGYLKNLALSVAGAWDRHFTVDWDGGHIKFFSPRTLRAMAESVGVRSIRFRYAGRLPLLWMSMLMVGER